MYYTAEEIIKGLNEKDKAVMPALIGKYGKQVFERANELIKNEDLSRRAVHNAFVAVLEYEGVFEDEAQLEAYMERMLVQSSAKLLAQRYKDVPEETLTRRRSNAESEAALAAVAAAKEESVKAEAVGEPEEAPEQAEEIPVPQPDTEDREAAPDMDEGEEERAPEKPGRLLSAAGILIALAALFFVLAHFKVISF